jgi:uncharacterized protein YjiS (DUF1127 family)
MAHILYIAGSLERAAGPKARPGTTPAVWDILVAAAVTIELWMERARQRRQLARLNDFQLKDIGLSRADVENEVSRPFWRQ